MTTRYKVFAAALGLVIATGAIGDVVAQTKAPLAGATQTTAAQPGATKNVVAKTAASKPVATKTTVSNKTVAGGIATVKAHRIHVAHRGTKLRVTHRLTTRGKIAHKLHLRHFAKASLKGKTTIVR